MTRDLTPFTPPSGEDCVEPELVDDGSRARTSREAGGTGGRERGGGTAGDAPKGGAFAGLPARLKFLFAAAILLVSFGLIALGTVLTFTLIGAVIGIPLILLGFLPLWLLFRLLSRGGGTVIFRRF